MAAEVGRITPAVNRYSSTWTAELEATTIRLWFKGFSAAQIGRELHRTRNAIIGKIFRLNLSPRVIFKSPPKPKARKQYKPKPRPKPVLALEPAPRCVAIHELEAGQCRFPFGHGPYLFCGAAASSSYCAFHERLVYATVSNARVSNSRTHRVR